MSEQKKSATLTYKDRPLRRKDNMIYYGSMAEPYIIVLQILATEKKDDLDVATKVAVQLQHTDANMKGRDKVAKKSEKGNLYDALDVGAVWLERALADR